jgi:hypothetical protein
MITQPRIISPCTVVTAAIAPAILKLTALYADAVASDNSRIRGQTLLAIARLRGLGRLI